MTSVTPSRRDRLRAATIEEIHTSARRLLVADGLAGVTLRAISREMGMTAPALYRYYDSLESLLEGLCATLRNECSEHLESGLAELPLDEPAPRLATACRAFRQWSIRHPAEFALMFASPATGAPDSYDDGPAHAAAIRLGALFLNEFALLWRYAPFPVAADDEIPSSLRVQFEEFRAHCDTDLPAGVIMMYTSCWIRLYGMVALEVFGHVHVTRTDAEPMFEVELGRMAHELGLELPPRD